ncbi:hypothetical protein [Natrinema marinum]|uniref:hypothetical protein n=1 Tax=Natrinema marinum TaxID=2961598 RepID=UPI0020C8EC96|nr:hypothetical protein [Natrinema marinum]
MTAPRSRPVRRLLLVLVAVAVVVAVAALSLEFPRDRVTVGALIVGASLLVGALALPALILAGWRSSGE